MQQLNSDNSKYPPGIALIISLLFAVLCSYFLYKELTLRIEWEGETIGTITYKHRTALRKYADHVIWEQIDENAEIYNHDAIRTENNSSAVIKLHDGTKIELDENTMLVVILDKKGVGINLDIGRVSASSSRAGSGKVTLKSREVSVSFEEGDILVATTDEDLAIQMNSGDARISVDGGEIGIPAGRLITVADGKTSFRKGILIPETPERNSKILTFSDTAPVNLSWQSDLKGPVNIELSDNSSFNPLTGSYSVNKNVHNLQLKPGVYYWRLTKDETTSQHSKFTVLRDNPPEPVSPGNNQVITMYDTPGMAAFRWNRSTYASGYKIKVAKNRNMKETSELIISETTNISIPGLQPGDYYWSVEPVYPSEFTVEHSKPSINRFTLNSIRFSETKPVPLTFGSVPPEESFRLNWKGIPGSEKYTVEIAEDSGFEKVTVVQNSQNTFTDINTVFSEGRYYWRVRASKENIQSKMSETAILDIALIKPEIDFLKIEKTKLLPPPMVKSPEIIYKE